MLRATADRVRSILDSTRTPKTWQRFDDALTALRAAVDADDAAALNEVRYELELLSRRVSAQYGQEPAGPPPPVVRDRANEMVHALVPDGTTAPPPR